MYEFNYYPYAYFFMFNQLNAQREHAAQEFPDIANTCLSPKPLIHSTTDNTHDYIIYSLIVEESWNSHQTFRMQMGS